MSSVGIDIACIVLFLLLLFSGIPIAFSLGASGFVGLCCLIGFEKTVNLCSTLSYTTVSSFTYAVIPLFILLGMLVTHTGMSKEIYDAFSAWLNRVPGGMGIATVWSCAAFGTLNGSAGVTASVFARASGPELVARGYNKELAYGMIAASGNIGQLIPPSILIVVYGCLSGDSIGQLLTAGIAPGLSLGIAFSLVLLFIAIFRPNLIPKCNDRFTWLYRIKILRNLIPVILVGGILVGGLLSGIYSSTEAGAIGAVIFFDLRLYQACADETYLKCFRRNRKNILHDIYYFDLCVILFSTHDVVWPVQFDINNGATYERFISCIYVHCCFDISNYGMLS